MGPFQTIVRPSRSALGELLDASPGRCRGPSGPAGISRIATTVRRSGASGRGRDHRVDRQPESARRGAGPRSSDGARAVSSRSRLDAASARRRGPGRARNVNAMPPPIRSASTLPSRVSISASLSETLAPPRIADERALRRSKIRPRAVELLLHQEPGHRRLEVPRDAVGRGVGAVGGGEGVVDVDVGRAAPAPRERRRRWPPPRVEAQVLEQQDSARLERARPGARRSAPTQSGASGTGRRGASARRRATGASENFGSGPPLGRPEMGGEHDARAPRVERVADGRERRADPRVVA